MLEKPKKYFRIYRKFFVTYLKSRLIYKADFIIGGVSQAINLFASLAFLTLLFTQVNNIRGWTLNELFFLAGLGGVILNIHHFFLFTLYTLGENFIVRGRLDRYKVRPLNVLFQIYSSYVADDNLPKIIVNFALIFYAASQLNIAIFTPVKLIYGFFAVISGVLVLAAIFLTLSTTAFWTGRSKAIFWLFFRISDFRKYPYPIYSAPVQIILITLIPIAFASFFPATFFLEKGTWTVFQLLSLVAGPVFYFLAYQFWKIGLSNYSSTGS